MSVPWPRSAVMRVVTPLSFSQANSRLSSARRMLWLLERAEQGFDRVQHDQLGADPIDRRGQTDEQPLQVVLTGLEKLVAFDGDLLDDQLLAADKTAEIEAQGERIVREVGGAFLEAHEDAGLAEIARAARQELDAEQGLAGAGLAADQRRTVPRQAAIGDLVETRGCRSDILESLGHQEAGLSAHSRELSGYEKSNATLGANLLSHCRCGYLKWNWLQFGEITALQRLCGVQEDQSAGARERELLDDGPDGQRGSRVPISCAIMSK